MTLVTAPAALSAADLIAGGSVMVGKSSVTLDKMESRTDGPRAAKDLVCLERQRRGWNGAARVRTVIRSTPAAWFSPLKAREHAKPRATALTTRWETWKMVELSGFILRGSQCLQSCAANKTEMLAWGVCIYCEQTSSLSRDDSLPMALGYHSAVIIWTIA